MILDPLASSISQQAVRFEGGDRVRYILLKLEPGERVIHRGNRNWGVGCVVDIDEDGDPVIEFEGGHRWTGQPDDDFEVCREPSAPDASASSPTDQELERRRVSAEIQDALEREFLLARTGLFERYGALFSETELDEKVLSFVRSWINEHGFFPGTNKRVHTPDREQALAIGAGHRDTLVVARAGSGKTATIVNRAWFLQRHCNVTPTEILMLAFNKKAAVELKERVEEVTGTEWPHVMTFHALAWALVRPAEDMIFDEDSAPRLKRYVQRVIDAQLKSSIFRDKLRNLILTRWRSSWESTVGGGYDLEGPELLQHRRLLSHESIRGDFVKSYGEKRIANFLFEHDVPYRYEAPYMWGDRVYRPDFTHYRAKGSGVVIEYFGMMGDPDYDAQRSQKIAFWAGRVGWELIEVTPEDVCRADFEKYFADALGRVGVRCRRLSEGEIWRRAERRGHTRFAESVTTFIQRARKRGFSASELQAVISAHEPASEIESLFLEVAGSLYGGYLRLLEEGAGLEDFDGLLVRAGSTVFEGRTTFARSSGAGDLATLKYIVIDEYQDFSPLFARMIAAVRARNPGVRLFCVGDDWQAINGFAGAELTWFRCFESQHVGAQLLHLLTNYRSMSAVVEVGNRIMESSGGRPARAGRERRGHVWLADLADFRASPFEVQMSTPDLAAISRLVADVLHPESALFGATGRTGEARDVVLLSRTKTLPWSFREQDSDGAGGLEAIVDALRQMLPEGVRDRIHGSTAHGYKGLQSQVVIVLDALGFRYPLVHTDWMLARVFGDTIDAIIEEERRLFYVATTRAMDVLILVTDSTNSSPFLADAEPLEPLDWTALKRPTQVVGQFRRLVEVANDPARFRPPGTFAIKDALKAEGFRYEPYNNTWYLMVGEDFFAPAYLRECAWLSQADGVELALIDARDRCRELYVIQTGIPTEVLPETRGYFPRDKGRR